jgi:putative ribosome biogenesis GTPase RsgA
MNLDFFNNIYFIVVAIAVVIIFSIRTILKPKENITKQRKGVYNTLIGDVNYLQELILTFSNKSSLLSSKKIERFIVFLTFLIVTIIFVTKKIDSLTTTEFLEILAVWLGYGGYNSFMNYKDRRLENNQTYTDSTSEVPGETTDSEIK